MLKGRIQAIKANRSVAKYFKSYTGEALSERLIVIGRHYDNQFQAPMLFLITCLAHIALGLTPNSITLFLAWAFVATRIGHSWIHLGSNNLLKRFSFFAAGWFIILILWVQLLISV